MTDPASLTLGIFGVVLPSIELARNIRSVFREIKNAPEQIERLENKIQISRDILHTLQLTSDSHDDYSRHLIRSLHDDYATSLDRLEAIIKSLVSKPKWKGQYKLISFQREIQEIEDIVKELEGRINLIASISMWNKSLQIETPSQSKCLIAEGHSSETLHYTSRARERVTKRRDCSLQYCSCSCHQSSIVNSRFWSITYSPFWSLFQRCDQVTCTARRYQVSFWVALSQIGMPLAVAVDLAIISKTGTWALVPSLRVRKVQKFTSRGFEIIWLCRMGRMDWPEARQAFIDFYRHNPDMVRHVDPEGRSYLERLIEGGPWYQESGQGQLQLRLIRLFCEDFNILFEFDISEKFVHYCLEWAANDLHLKLMFELLLLGFDSDIIAPIVGKPRQHGTLLMQRSESYAEYFKMLLSKDPEFGGTTPLHLSIFYNSKERFEKLLGSESCLEKNTNLLGQSPLHIAASHPTYLSLLLSKGHPVDVNDKFRNTPLAYAVSGNHVESAVLLIDAGADIRNAVRCSCVIARVVRYDDAEFFWDKVIRKTLRGSWSSAQILRELLDLLNNPSHTFFREKNSFFHYITTREQGTLLLDCGFTGINQENRYGQQPLASVIHFPDAAKFCLDNGGEVNHQDKTGRTALMKLARIFSFNGRAVITLRNLLISGADTRLIDSCRGCACAPKGCMAGDSLIWIISPSSEKLLSIILWLTTIEEYRETEEVKQSLLVVLRQILFLEFRIDHICCSSMSTTLTKRNLHKHMRYCKTLDERMELLKARPYKELKSLLSQLIARHIVTPEIDSTCIPVIDYHNDRFIFERRYTQQSSTWRMKMDSLDKCIQNDYQQRISEATEDEHERIHEWHKSTTDWLDQVRGFARTFEEQNQLDVDGDLEMMDDFETINNLGVNAALPVLAVIAGSIFSIFVTNSFQSG